MSLVSTDITVLNQHSSAVALLVKDSGYVPDDVDANNDGTMTYAFSYVRNGDLGIEKKLKEKDIPYDRWHGEGDDFDEQYDCFRVLASGDHKSYEDNERDKDLHSTDEIKAWANKSNTLESLLALMQDKLDSQKPSTWEEQRTILDALLIAPATNDSDELNRRSMR